MIKIGVWPHKYPNGADNISGPHKNDKGEEITLVEAQLFTIFELAEKEFDTFAHFSCYHLAGTDEDESWPRINKPCLSSIRVAGCDLVSNLLVLDWDAPYTADDSGKAVKTPMNEELVGVFASILYGHDDDGELGKWCMAYTTNHGGRVIYQLPCTVKVEAQENLVSALHAKWAKAGVEMDAQCKDWTRFFQCPKVIRDGKKTWENPFFECEVREDVFLDPEKLLSNYVDVHKQLIPEAPISEDMPMSWELEDLLTDRSSGREKQSAFFKEAKAALRNTFCYPYAFEDKQIPEGQRNQTIMKLIGTAVPILLRKCKEIGPEHVFALFYHKICALVPDSGTPCWLSFTWREPIRRIWSKEVAAFNLEKEREALDKKVRYQRSLSTIDNMVNGMRRWCDSPQLHSENMDEAREFVKSYCIAVVVNRYFLMGPTGEFDYEPVTKDSLVAKIRKSHLCDIIATSMDTSNGGEKAIPAQSIINDHAVVVGDNILKMPQIEFDGMIQNIQGANPVLIKPMYRRNPNLEATYDKYVDNWLMAMFGEHYEKACEWIAQALNFEGGPICALSIKGPGGVGKKLLTAGLAECLENPVLASGTSLIDRFNEDISKTPFMAVNEGLDNHKGVGDKFKSLTAGDGISIEEKFKPKVTIINPMRIIFTANDHDLINALADGKHLTPESRQAIGERLLHFDLNANAVAYLNSIGGRMHTSKPGARWIRDDNGNGIDSPSDFVVAKHFLWLYENREPADRRNRYLVMGNAGGTTHQMFNIILQKPTTSMCIRAIVKLSTVTGKNAMRFDVDNAKIYVTVAGLYEYIFNTMDQKITIMDVKNALTSLAATERGVTVDDMRWVEINCEAVLRYCEDMGIEAKQIRGFVMKQYELKSGGIR